VAGIRPLTRAMLWFEFRKLADDDLRIGPQDSLSIVSPAAPLLRKSWTAGWVEFGLRLRSRWELR